ncbi:phospholipase D-like domain-containing protein [Oceaniglobus ichthyenteri]|uniref:phospholipase D-like domain-containing protein n=1 Tax=Oceaniglobus ichthyenteri TaxID=2136177 RepID=UPI000D34EA5F|nr:phospholipase D-like domain-containing protein [Oceaniglobus ichthyenteri]
MLKDADAKPDRVSEAVSPDSIFQPGENCWRVARADKLALIVDAADYFRVLRKVFVAAKRELLLIGWDFDFELEMLPGESDADGLAPDGFPNQLGAFVEAIVERSPELHVYLLKWNGAVLAAPGRLIPSLALGFFSNDRVHFALDGHHPFGACHHQKIVVADDALAFCGGIDATEDRWDTSEHLPDDPRRVRKDGSPSDPWHDATSALFGPVASALAELSRKRWHRATGETLERPQKMTSPAWPDGLSVDATDTDVAIARTEPPFDGDPLINEIEQLYLDGIRAAKHTIYIESQYFAAETICAALKQRLQEHDGPEIVVINPKTAQSQLEDDAMHVLRERMIEHLRDADHQDRFRIYYPVTKADQPIYVHAKIMIIDDCLLRLGSSNINDRSMGFDTECDVAIEGPGALITDFRTRLLSEHLGVSPQEFGDASTEKGRLIPTIQRLNAPKGRGLRVVSRDAETMVGGFLAKTRLLDPRYHPGEVTSAGQGLRPRHLVFALGGAVLGWLAWRKWGGRGGPEG